MSTADEVFQKALRLADRPDQDFLELSRCLAELRDQDPHMLNRFVGASRMGRRKAFYLATLGRQLRRLGTLPEERLRSIGWSKLQLISKQLTAKDADRLFKLAEENSTLKLARLMRGERPDPKPRHVLLVFSPEQYRTFERDVLRHGARRSGRGLIRKEEAVLRIFEKARGAELQTGGESPS
jgi:hypothetical protein